MVRTCPFGVSPIPLRGHLFLRLYPLRGEKYLPRKKRENRF